MKKINFKAIVASLVLMTLSNDAMVAQQQKTTLEHRCCFLNNIFPGRPDTIVNKLSSILLLEVNPGAENAEDYIFGSGVFISHLYDSDSIYFLTAKHTLENLYANTDIYSDALIRISAYKEDKKIVCNMRFDTLLHVTYQKQSDLDVQVITFCKSDLLTNDLYSIDDLEAMMVNFNELEFLNDSKLSISDNVHHFGYPGSLDMISTMGNSNFKPMYRKGYVAAKYIENSRFVADMRVFHGDSGGAVYFINENGKIRLIGITIETVMSYGQFTGFSIIQTLEKSVFER